MITAAQEQEKYRRMWTEVPDYRRTSPGEALVPTFLHTADWAPGDSLMDVGCGTGRAGLVLSRAGFLVFLFDITSEARDPEVSRLPFIEGCLWDGLGLRRDWIYCCDVLEHIPPEHVDKSLDAIKECARLGAFLQIALFKDGYGAWIGDTLHLTVERPEWWKQKIEARFSKVRYLEATEGRLIAITGEYL